MIPTSNRVVPYNHCSYHLPKFNGAALSLCLVSSPLAADNLYTQNLDCQKQISGRTIVFCPAPEKALEWRCTGHAIISPRLRISLEGLRRTCCSLPISYRDTELLVDMAFHTKSRSEMSRHSHAQYVKTQISLPIAETSTSIFNPQHRYYILRSGCR